MKDFVADRREKVFSAMNLELTELLALDDATTEQPVEQAPTEQPTEENNNTIVQAQLATQTQKPEVKKEYETYTGILEIPKINFSKGFYKKDSSLNNVKFNIKILPQSSYPDEDKGNTIIIGHSGNYNNSYFANLYKLELGDTASIKYNNKLYTYRIENIYTDTKDGTVTIYRDETKTCLTLITCTKDDNTTQTIYILELVSIQ
jgi:LPXTG-site transpeptidase (sortase) family protein